MSGMATYFAYFSWGLLVPALVLTLLLTIPMPRFMHSAVMRLVNFALSFTTRVGPVNVSFFTMAILLSTLTFAKATIDMMVRQQRYDEAKSHPSAALATPELMYKWRAERNFWIAAMCLALYWILLRVFVLSKKLAKLEKERRQR